MLHMPTPNPTHLADREQTATQLRALIPTDRVISDPARLSAYDSDGLPIYRQAPMIVVLPDNSEEVATLLRFCHAKGLKVVPRGAATSLSGGAMPLADCVVIDMMRMRHVLEIDAANRCVTVQAGVTNVAITEAVRGQGMFYAPDPSSQLACSIGGNVAMNSGGAHCLKYGVTGNHILGLTLITIEGEIVRLGGKHLDAAGIDWIGLLTGSEGQLGIVTEVTVRVIGAAEGARSMLVGFSSNEAAAECVSAILRAGIIPVALEFMDRFAIHAAEAFAHAGYPLDAEALLIIEVEGDEPELDRLLAELQTLCESFDPVSLRLSQSAIESAAIWKGRKMAFGALGRISPDYVCTDGVIPPGRLAESLRRVAALGQLHGLRVANIFHAGDGNLHPIILFDGSDPDSVERAETLGNAILSLCVEMGGCLSGEHGIGVEKRDVMSVQFLPHELEQQRRIKRAFDPQWLLNPGKVFPLEATP